MTEQLLATGMYALSYIKGICIGNMADESEDTWEDLWSSQDEEGDEVVYPTKQKEKQEILRLIKSLRGIPIWNESEVQLNAETVLFELKEFNFNTLNPVVGGNNAAKYKFAMRKDRNIMSKSLERLWRDMYDRNAGQNLYDVYTAVFGFILGSFNLPYPREGIESVRLKYDKDLFLRNIVKRGNAEAIIKQNEEKNDPTHMIPLQRLLAFAVGLLHEVVSARIKDNEDNHEPTLHAHRLKSVLQNNFYVILDAWTTELNRNELGHENLDFEQPDSESKSQEDEQSGLETAHSAPRNEEANTSEDGPAPQEDDNTKTSPVDTTKGGKERDIKKTQHLIKLLRTTPILPKGTLDNTNFREQATANVEEGLKIEMDKYKEIYHSSDVDDELRYCETMVMYLQGIDFYLTCSNYIRSLEENVYEAYTFVFGFILGSFDMPKPNTNIMKKVEFRYASNLFLRNNVKTKRAAEIIVENEERMKSRKKDGTYSTFLQKLLTFAVCLFRQYRTKITKQNRKTEIRRHSVDRLKRDDYLDDFYIVLDTWNAALNATLGKPEQEEDTEAEQENYDNDKNFPAPTLPTPQDDWANAEDDLYTTRKKAWEITHTEVPQNIKQVEIANRIQKYREEMASLIDSVNIHWRPIAIQAPAVWYNESLLDVENVTTVLKAAMLMHDFYTVSHLRTSKSGQEWDDIWPLARQITLENTTPNRPFLASVLETLETSLDAANVKRQSRNQGKTFFFEEYSYNRAYQRAIGFALICVKRLLWRWYMDATFQNAVPETANVEEYHGRICHALFSLTVCYRAVACYRAVQDSDHHDLNYADRNVKTCNITRWQLETPVPSDVTYMGETIKVAKYRLSNPRNNPECCKEYVDEMKGLCERTYAKLRDVWRLDATSWHGQVEFYAQDLLAYLDKLQRKFIYGTNSVAKRYWSRKWNMQTRRKEAVEENWIDHFVQTQGNGLSFFKWMFQYFFNLQEDRREKGFTANPIFPGEVCFSRKYIQRVRYLKTSLKRVLYMMTYKQIPSTYECQLLVQDATVTASVYLEVVLAIYALQQSESRSLDYMKANWKWKCEAELAIPDARPVRNIPGAGWGK